MFKKKFNFNYFKYLSMQYKKFKDKRGRGLKQKTLFAKFKVENGKQKIYLNNRNDYPKV